MSPAWIGTWPSNAIGEIGLTEGATIERISRPLYRFVLGKLRKAESAVRRLIVVAARNIVVEPPEKHPVRVEHKSPGKGKDESKGNEPSQGEDKRKRRPLFRLFDPPRRFRTFFSHRPKPRQVEPRAYYLDVAPGPQSQIFLLFYPPQAAPQPAPPAPVPEAEESVEDDTVNAGPLIRRLLAITDALQDIPRQAMRLALWQARPVEERRPPRSSPLRSGRPPGFRQRPKHEVDEILKECHWLARNVYPQLDDTS